MRHQWLATPTNAVAPRRLRSADGPTGHGADARRHLLESDARALQLLITVGPTQRHATTPGPGSQCTVHQERRHSRRRRTQQRSPEGRNHGENIKATHAKLWTIPPQLHLTRRS
ncbi:hypothetical protein E2562_024188 [Oryza meyeriana var. granulata]|uniref:Uncharacterized protein n=1 Tax=Oryza meyeriana var. granulata TaxID=110450 RepID=A0A6G1BYF7_9ORYZ|nr:hypothetical protein E2562_024188 [Oryza meyeriana var. granulata]